MKGKNRNSLIVLGVVVSLVALLLSFGCKAAPPPAAPGAAEAELRAKIAGLESEVKGMEADKKGLEAEVKELAAPPKVFKFRCQHYHTPESDVYKAWERTAERLREMSNGRIDITLYAAGAIVGSRESLEAVARGVVEMAYTSPIYFIGIVPADTFAGNVVMGWRNTVDMSSLYYELGFLEELRKAHAEHNIYYLGSYPLGSLHIWATRPIQHVEDFEGFKIRAYGDSAKTFTELGAACIQVDHSETYIAMATGTIDGSFTALSVYEGYKQYEVCPYLMVPGLKHSGGAFTMINMDVWNSLPDDLKEMFELASRWHFYDLAQRVEINWIEIQEKMGKEWGSSLVTMDDELVKKLTEIAITVWKEEAKDAHSTKMYETLVDLCRSRGYIE